MEYRWVDAEHGAVPPLAVQGGAESDGKPLFVGRGEHKKGVHVGKISPQFGGLLIGYGGKEVKLKKYQVLCGDASQLRWVESEGNMFPQGWRLVEGGKESDGAPLYIAKVHYQGGQHIGKAGIHLKNGASIAFASKEINVPNYSVLAYADSAPTN